MLVKLVSGIEDGVASAAVLFRSLVHAIQVLLESGDVLEEGAGTTAVFLLGIVAAGISIRVIFTVRTRKQFLLVSVLSRSASHVLFCQRKEVIFRHFTAFDILSEISKTPPLSVGDE